MNLTLFATVLAFIAGSGFLYLGVKRWRKTQLVQNTPTESVSSMALGRTELQGTAEPVENVMSQPFGDGECLYTWYEVEEYQRQASRDGEERSKWQTVMQDEVALPFAVDDGTGTAYVDVSDEPEFKISKENQRSIYVDARESEPEEVQEFLEYNNMKPSHDGVSGFVSGVRRRYRQAVLPVGEDVYVFGNAEKNDNGETVIRRDKETDQFFIADRDATSLARSLRIQSAGLMSTGLAFFVLGFYVLLFGLPTGL